jgi:uncharacterized membrane protein YkoI
VAQTEFVMLKKSILAGLIAAALSIPVAQPALAGEADHERARQALEAGEVLPLRVILDRIERDYPGRVVEIELERDDGRWRYEIKLLQRGGRMLKLEVDAVDARVLRVKGRGSGEPRREERTP